MSKDLLPIHSIDNQPITHTLCRLSHGLVMDLQQAVQLEKQELKKMGISIEVDMAQLTMVSPEKDNQSQNISTPPHWLDRQQRLATTRKYGGCPPCSPPVPIPQHHEAQRRYSAAGSLGETLTHSLDDEQLQSISTSQCKARVCDESCNYKLSFEYREPFEVSTCQANERSRNDDQRVDMTATMAALFKYRSDLSTITTAKSVNENDDDPENMVSSKEDEHVFYYGDVFVMEDL
ncbi:unnamed protein product [Peronospora destructor]|uniref:Uncharacterized protein n=1 Tax=Peronospora destructor TaxID=86335 RepID=A0AAV0TX54_9STRA|nr:unnamed protein product [Peronospora destructor]